MSAYKEGLLSLVKCRAGASGLAIGSDSNLDMAFRKLCQHNRRLGGDIYDHAKELPEFYTHMASSRTLSVVRKLIGAETIQVALSQCVFRIDQPEEDKYAFDWHQDYWYNCLTPNAVTCWFPLTSVTEEEGPLEVIPGSHKAPFPVIVADPSNTKGNMALIFKPSKKTPIDEKNAVSIPVKAGDALFFHSYLLHRSGKNRSDRSRWTVQYRYSDFLDPAYASRGWSHGTYRGKVTFCELHPELIASE